MRHRSHYFTATWMLFALACFILVFVVRKDPTGHHATFHAGNVWWVIMGVWIGLIAGTFLYVLATRPRPIAVASSPWQVDTLVNDRAQIAVCLVDSRCGKGATLATINPQSETFDETLHKALADAQEKVAALHVAGK